MANQTQQAKQIDAEREKITAALTKNQVEAERLSGQLAELDAAERVFARLSGRKPMTTTPPTETTTTPTRRGRPRKNAASTTGAKKAKSSSITMGDAALKAVTEHPGATNAQVGTYLTKMLGKAIRPNHIGISLARHKRAGRLETRDGKWYPPASQAQPMQMAS